MGFSLSSNLFVFVFVFIFVFVFVILPQGSGEDVGSGPEGGSGLLAVNLSVNRRSASAPGSFPLSGPVCDHL